MTDFLAPLAFLAFLFALMIGLGLLAFGWGNPFPPLVA